MKKNIITNVWWVLVWWWNPIRIQSMTNTKTSDIESTFLQIKDLYENWSELVRITINDDKSAQAVPFIINKLKEQWINVPIIWDFHFNGHILLEKYSEMSKLISKYRINPWNVWMWNKKDDNFRKIIECAIKYNKPIRIWVNSWSLDEDLLAKNMKKLKNEKPNAIFIKTMVESAIISVKKAQEYWLNKDKIILSVKMSDLQDMVKVYEILSLETEQPIHLWLTEAWWWIKWIISSSVALWILLQKWIWDTIRISITPEPWKSRIEEVKACKYLLQSMWLRFFQPQIISCPWCWRTSSNEFQKLSKKVSEEIDKRMPKWKIRYKNFENTKIAIMWCIVNWPWESKNADIWISLPWDFENPKMPVYIKWKLFKNLSWDKIFEEFMDIIEEYFTLISL